jgi:hypothetical protein
MFAREMFCPNCGTVGNPESFTRGSFFIELALWLCFIVPGLIYSIWRLSSRYKGCPACEQPGMVPLDSPRARAEMKARGVPGRVTAM